MFSKIFKKKNKVATFDLSTEQDEFLSGAIDEYNLNIAKMDEKYEITRLGWGYEQNTLKLQLLEGGNPIYEADAQISGSFYQPHGTWEWAWNNPNVERNAAKDSLLVKKYGNKKDLDYLRTGTVNVVGEETFAAYLAAIAFKLSSADFVYRGKVDDDLSVYLLVSNVKKIG